MRDGRADKSARTSDEDICIFHITRPLPVRRRKLPGFALFESVRIRSFRRLFGFARSCVDCSRIAPSVIETATYSAKACPKAATRSEISVKRIARADMPMLDD